jgi:hypothetical protein
VSVELYAFAPPDVEELVIAWLTPLGTTSVERPAGAILPYRMVTRVAGANTDLISDDPVVSVHTFAATRTQAKTEARNTHRRMMVLANNPMTDVVLAGGLKGNVEYLETVEGPCWQPYADNQTISRYIARYRLGLKFVAV